MLNKILIINGYGWSGSGLLIDVLKKHSNCFSIDKEIRFFKDSGGIIDLYNSLDNSHSVFNYDVELNRFLKLSEISIRKNNIKLGLDLESKINLKSDILDYINFLKKKSFKSDAFVFHYYNSITNIILWKLKRRFNLKIKEIHYLPPNKNDFICETRNLFSKFILDKYDYTILDQLTTSVDNNYTQIFFHDSKIINVDRDPRDIYIDYKNSRDVILNPKQFVYLYKHLRNNKLEPKKNTLNIEFEKLVNDCEVQLKIIFDFLNINFTSKNDEVYKYIEQSKKNIGKYKKYKNQDDIRYIEKNLERYYKFKN